MHSFLTKQFCDHTWSYQISYPHLQIKNTRIHNMYIYWKKGMNGMCIQKCHQIIHNSLHPPQIPSHQNNFPISFQLSFGIPSLRSDVWPLGESLWNPGPHWNNKNPKTLRESKTMTSIIDFWIVIETRYLSLTVHCKFKTSLYDMWSLVVPVVEWWVACDAHPPRSMVALTHPQPCCCQGLLFSIQHLH